MSDTTSPLWTRRTLLAAAGLMIVCGVLLHLEGRIAWCKCGFGLWSAAWTESTSQHFLDPYSLSHVLHGVIFYWLLRPFANRIPLHIRMLLAIGMEVGWEVLENSPPIIERYRQDTAAFDYVGDSILNAMGDVLSAVIGIAFAARFSWKASVALFFVFELWMLFLARDNLTLNILMLLFSLEPIKQWQLAH
jgi:hypothetical protein